MNQQLQGLIVDKIQDAISEIMEEHRLKCVRSDSSFKLVTRSKKSKHCAWASEVFAGLMDGEYTRKPKR